MNSLLQKRVVLNRRWQYLRDDRDELEEMDYYSDDDKVQEALMMSYWINYGELAHATQENESNIRQKREEAKKLLHEEQVWRFSDQHSL